MTEVKTFEQGEEVICVHDDTKHFKEDGTTPLFVQGDTAKVFIGWMPCGHFVIEGCPHHLSPEDWETMDREKVENTVISEKYVEKEVVLDCMGKVIDSLFFNSNDAGFVPFGAMRITLINMMEEMGVKVDYIKRLNGARNG